ncbi:MAG: DUF87 domain-containing protein [Phototrophicales bacterium]
MPFIEAPTTFYLGRRYNPQTNRLDDDVVYYDSRDLTTHAVVVGMTGSGKTGLCITMLEEAILDNIPAIIIDPKGDITNLMLNFPDLKPEDFKPWINIDDARRAGMDVDAYAADVAQRWRDGLQSWGIVPDRLRWRDLATQISVYTPGSDAGLPISILASLKAPKGGFSGQEEVLREKINGITTALLALAGINAEPVKDPEHVLLTNIFEYNWRQGIDLTLEDIILQVQKPPFDKLGVMPIDQFMSEKKRFSLAMELNNIIAAPTFQSWMVGQSLDIKSLLYQPNGRPRVSIFYTAHLNEQERMFITTLILENMLSWMRGLSGTTSLRAILYIDEMFGYFPPYPKNPPTKEPILRLLKQARAFGIGLILATQNPGDLDYKGLTNAGTWFIGRLQSENDKKKVIDGLRSMATTDDSMKVEDVAQMIADIPPRVFLMRNVHDSDSPLLLHTRWCMSYLRGPLTRQQIEILMRPQREALLAKLQQKTPQHMAHQNWQQTAGIQSHYPNAPVPAPPQLPGMPSGLPGQKTLSPQEQYFGAQAVQPSQPSMPTPARGNLPQGFTPKPPPVSSSIAQYYLPPQFNMQQALGAWQQSSGVSVQNVQGGMLVYKPVLLVQAVVRYQDRKANVYTARIFTYEVPDLRQAGLIHWEDYLVDPIDARSVATKPLEPAAFGDLPPGLTDNSRLKQLKTEVVDMLYNTAMLVIPFNPDLKIYGNPDEEFSIFQADVQQAAREARDKEMDKVSQKFAGMMEKLEEKYRRKQQELTAEKKEIRDRRLEELFTTGEALASIWKGRFNYTLSRMSRATRYRRQTKEDIKESEEFLAEIEEEIAKLEQDFEAALAEINDKWARIAANTQEYVINPYKKDIQLELFGIGWLPAWMAIIQGQPTLLLVN